MEYVFKFPNCDGSEPCLTSEFEYDEYMRIHANAGPASDFFHRSVAKLRKVSQNTHPDL